VSSVLDASAILAAVFQEPGAERVEQAIRDDGIVLSVNLAEVVTRLVDKGSSEADIRRILDNMALQIVPFDEDLAYRAGMLRTATRAAGLSLGDRACLALAEQRGLPALTADRTWATLPLDIDVDVIR
jgi:ribonuclease VapC